MCGLLLAPGAYPDELLHKALQKMSYRGTPQGGLKIESEAGWKLGHVRLPIQTLPTDDPQPYRDEMTGRVTAFVGEIFGTFDIKTGTSSEMKVLTKVLRTPRLQGFHDLDGFWSTAEISPDGWARVTTDHLGIKPLYHWVSKGIVCSELEPMFVLEPKRPGFDETYLSNCLKFGYDYSGATPYRGIRQVAPGTAVILDAPGQKPWVHSPEYHDFKYWDWNSVPLPPTEPFARDLRDLVVQAIYSRANESNMGVALLMSGGLDSSIIYYSLLQKLGIEPWAFALENGESEFLPSGVEVLPMGLGPSWKVSYSEAVDVMQAPLDLGSLFPQIQLAKVLKANGVRVCLSGDGADELFGGYRRAAQYDSQASDVFCELPYYHLPRLDRVMMRGTIELRSPFLSPKVVAYALRRVPREDRTSKQTLKAAFLGIVPQKILAREKHPLKSAEVLADPLQHRIKLMEAFRAQYH